MVSRFSVFALFCLCGFAFPAFAAVRHASADVRASATLDEIAKHRESRVPPVAPPRIIHEPQRVRRTRGAAEPTRPQIAAAPLATTANAPISYTGFLGLLDNFTAIPPDTTGAVSPLYVVTMLNTQVNIQSRTGVARTNYPISLNAFWSPLGSFHDTFDPRILYDEKADRWIACAGLGPASPSSALLVAVSQTGDPGGGWHYFQVDVGPENWGDFPVLGFNGNWVTVSINVFRLRKDSYQGTSLYVFNKADLYRGGTGSHSMFSDNNGELVPALDADNRPDTMYFVQAFGGSRPAVRLSTLQGQPGSETFAGGNGGQAPFIEGWADTGPGGNDLAPQLDSTVNIDAGDSRLQNCVLRSGTIWCTQTIFLPAASANRSAVQWFQVDPSGPQILQRGRIDDPTRTYFYAYPSIAVNRNMDVMIGFTRFGANEYAAAGFAFRVASDPAGALEPEVIFKRGEAVYISPGLRTGSNRWGDYSATRVDPADDLAFWTLQEYATTPPEGRTGQFGTWWAKVTAPSAGLKCVYTLSNTIQTLGPGSATGSVSVSTTSACPWMAASNARWIQIASGNPGLGNGSVTYTVAANPDPNTPRSGTITIAGQTFSVTQTTPPVGVDLAVTSMTAPVSAEPGQQVTVSANVANLSGTAAAAFRIGLYLGTGSSITSHDTLLGSCPVSGLAPAASVNCTRTVSLPAAIQPGRYLIGAVADDQSAIADPNAANNARTSEFGAIVIAPATVRPAVPAQGIVNAASYQGGGVAPGELVTLFGAGLGPASAQFPIVNALGFVDTIAGGARVLFDGIAASMVSASAGQVSAVVPFAVAGRANTQVQVEYLGTRSDPVTIPVVIAAPAIFTVDGSGKGGGAILNEDLRVNAAANPAARGSVIVIYATGAGAMPGVVEGKLAQSPFVQLTQPVSVRIGGALAQVTYAGVAPGLIAGVLQINAIVPAATAPDKAAPIEFSIGEVTSQPGVTVAVQ